MNSSASLNLLKNKHTRSLGEARIILQQLRTGHARDKIASEKAVRGELVVSMFRNPDLTFGNQGLDLFQGVAHASQSNTGG